MTPTTLKPFLSYYGAKWRAAKRYPSPEHGTIVEPFAGSAGYAIRHYQKNVILVDKDPVIVAVWDYLISVTPEEILGLPDVPPGDQVDDLRVPQEARWLIGFWLNAATSRPNKRPSKWMREAGPDHGSFWNKKKRDLLASQVRYIRHWLCLEASYHEIDPFPATWFVDPPYQNQGKHYVHGSGNIDFRDLSRWCRRLPGQVVVCEQEGADWLPFLPHGKHKGTAGSKRKGSSQEVVWLGP
jgi:hypothetical protein